MSQAQHDTLLYPQVDLRPASKVMRLKRMGSFFPTRVSFMRTLIRRLSADKVQVTRPVWEISDAGFGRAVYSVDLGGFTYSLVAFATELDPSKRTDRVIAEAWDASFSLFDGVPTTADLDRLQENTPHQEAGRFTEKELTLSRANKSIRLFENVVDSLSKGQQPDEQMIASIGYLMRTTAVYGNGKFGISDRSRFAERHGLSGPFQAELLTVWLIRGFTHDLAEHVARQKSPDTFVPLEPRLKRHLGIGNSTGLGMAPFLVSHPILLNNWMMVRETGLARVRAVETATPDVCKRLAELGARVELHLQQWNVPDELQMSRVEVLRKEFIDVLDLLTPEFLSQAQPWDKLINHSESWSLECQELLVSLVMELYPELCDGLDECMSSLVSPKLNPLMKLSELKSIVTDQFDWALKIDFSEKSETCQFWYVSEEKLEPRLGDRYEEDGAELEMPVDIARLVQSLNEDLAKVSSDQSVAEFLMKHPQHRYVTRRIQCCKNHPYSEICDNLIGEGCLPIDMLRSKLSFFGASKFDPKSDRWTRITMFQGAPMSDEISQSNADDWWLPVLKLDAKIA